MSSASEICLTNVEWPRSLLQCNSALLRMASGDRLDIRMHDAEIANALILIISRSDDLSAKRVEQNGQIRISVHKK